MNNEKIIRTNSETTKKTSETANKAVTSPTKSKRRRSLDLRNEQPVKKLKLQPQTITLQPDASFCSALATQGIEKELLPYLFNRTMAQQSDLRNIINLAITSKTNKNIVQTYLALLVTTIKGNHFIQRFIDNYIQALDKPHIDNPINNSFNQCVNNNDNANEQQPKTDLINGIKVFHLILKITQVNSSIDPILLTLNTILKDTDTSKKFKAIQALEILAQNSYLDASKTSLESIKATVTDISSNKQGVGRNLNMEMQAATVLELLNERRKRGC